MRRVVAAVAFAIASALASGANAGVEDTFGLGAKPMALAGSYAARPGDFAACYYNPAGLAPGGSLGDAEKGGFFEADFGFVYGHAQLHVTGASRANLATPHVDDTAGVVLGARFSLGRLFHIDGLDAGFSAFVPGNVFQWSIRPDDDVQWALLTDRTQVISIHAGLAYRLTRWLSFGLGMRVLFGAQTLTRGEVTSVGLAKDPTTGKTVVLTGTQLGTDAEVFGQASPEAGLLLTPSDRSRIALVYRHKSYVDDWGNTRISGVPDIGDLGYSHHFSHYFEPSEVTMALGVDVTRALDVSFDLTWGHWSEGVSTNFNTFASTSWGDTWTPALGARYRVAPPLALMAGYRFQKSPVQNFGGPSNLVDSDRHVPSVGLELDLGKLFHTPSLDARVTLGLQYVALTGGTETKDFRLFSSDSALSSNPGYPSYSYGGHVMAASMGVTARW